jgi:hypothetical protein
MVSSNDNRPPGTVIHFGSLKFPFNGEGEAIRALEARPPLLGNLGTTVRPNGVSHVERTPGASIHFGSIDFTIGREGDMVRVAPARPVPRESSSAISVALGALSLILCGRRGGLDRPRLPRTTK